MINNKEDLEYYIKEDLKRNWRKENLNIFEYYLALFLKQNRALATRYLISLRRLEYAKNCLKNKSFLGRLVYAYRLVKHQRLSYKYDIDLRPNTIGYGLYLPHIVGGGIVANCLSMGNYCAINCNVLLGNKNSNDEKPVIGNRVDITTGSKIIGKIHIGDNVIVAPNSVVVKDVPDNAIVSGIPATLLKFRSNE